MALKKWLDKLALLDLFDGLSVTGRHFFRRKVTIQYPEQKKIPSDRFRGMFRLDEERWEVLVEESSEDELDAVLHAVARWAADCSLEEASVLVDGKHVELPEA